MNANEFSSRTINSSLSNFFNCEDIVWKETTNIEYASKCVEWGLMLFVFPPAVIGYNLNTPGLPKYFDIHIPAQLHHLKNFMDGKFSLVDLTIIQQLNGKYFKDLEHWVQRRLEEPYYTYYVQYNPDGNVIKHIQYIYNEQS